MSKFATPMDTRGVRLGKVPPKRDLQVDDILRAQAQHKPNCQSVGNLGEMLCVADRAQVDMGGQTFFGDVSMGGHKLEVAQRTLRVEKVRCGVDALRYAWDPKERKLYYSPDTSPPDWMLDGLWRRLVALDVGAIDDLFEVPLEAPRPVAPSVVPPELELVSGERLTNLGALQGVPRRYNHSPMARSPMESDADLRGRINEKVRAELGPGAF